MVSGQCRFRWFRNTHIPFLLSLSSPSSLHPLPLPAVEPRMSASAWRHLTAKEEISNQDSGAGKLKSNLAQSKMSHFRNVVTHVLQHWRILSDHATTQPRTSRTLTTMRSPSTGTVALVRGYAQVNMLKTKFSSASVDAAAEGPISCRAAQVETRPDADSQMYFNELGQETNSLHVQHAGETDQFKVCLPLVHPSTLLLELGLVLFQATQDHRFTFSDYHLGILCFCSVTNHRMPVSPLPR